MHSLGVAMLWVHVATSNHVQIVHACGHHVPRIGLSPRYVLGSRHDTCRAVATILQHSACIDRAECGVADNVICMCQVYESAMELITYTAQLYATALPREDDEPAFAAPAPAFLPQILTFLVDVLQLGSDLEASDGDTPPGCPTTPAVVNAQRGGWSHSAMTFFSTLDPARMHDLKVSIAAGLPEVLSCLLDLVDVPEVLREMVRGGLGIALLELATRTTAADKVVGEALELVHRLTVGCYHFSNGTDLVLSSEPEPPLLHRLRIEVCQCRGQGRDGGQLRIYQHNKITKRKNCAVLLEELMRAGRGAGGFARSGCTVIKWLHVI
jgi:hypothetical protein